MNADVLALGALQALSLAVIGYAAWQAVRDRRLYAFLFLGLVAYQLVMTLGLGALAEEFGVRTMFAAEMAMLLGAVMLVTGVMFFERLTRRFEPVEPINPVAAASDAWPHYRNLVILCAGIALGIAVRRGSSVLEVNWEEVRGEATFLDQIATLLQFFIFPATWIAFRAGRRVWALFFAVLAVAAFALFGSRAALLTGVAVIGVDLFRSQMARSTKLRVMLLLASAGLTLHIVGRIVRGLGLGGVYRLLVGETDAASLGQEIAETVEWTGGEYEIARYFAFAVKEGPFSDIHPLASVIRWFSMYLPTSSFQGLKPEDATYALWRHAADYGVFDSYAAVDQIIALLQKGDTGSIHPMLWGEFWINGGWAAIPIAALLLAMQMVMFERLLERVPGVVASLVMPVAAVGWLMVARGNSVIGLGYTYYLLPAALGVWLLYGGLRLTFRILITPLPRAAQDWKEGVSGGADR
jgi:hypothetical protein